MSTTTPAAYRGTEHTETGLDVGTADAPIGPTAPDALDRRYRALSDPKRRRILALLRKGERCVCELVDAMDVSQSLLSFHLKALKEAELVDDRRDGRWVHYRARPDALAELRAHLAGLAPARGDGSEEPYRCC